MAGAALFYLADGNWEMLSALGTLLSALISAFALVYAASSVRAMTLQNKSDAEQLQLAIASHAGDIRDPFQELNSIVTSSLENMKTADMLYGFSKPESFTSDQITALRWILVPLLHALEISFIEPENTCSHMTRDQIAAIVKEFPDCLDIRDIAKRVGFVSEFVDFCEKHRTKSA